MEMKGSKDYLSQLSFPNLIVHVIVHVFRDVIDSRPEKRVYPG